MKVFFTLAFCCVLALCCAAQNTSSQAGNTQTSTVPTLESVLTKMDDTAAKFKDAQADFVWDQYEDVVKSHDKQSGTIYFRRKSNKLEMGADIKQPTPKKVVYSADKVNLYEPKIDQLTIYSTAKNKAEFESFLVLGFGGRGHDLAKDFTVSFAGVEMIENIRAAKLKLVPKTEKARNVFNEIDLWIDPTQGLSVRQKFIEPSGNYRDAMYSNIKLNQGVPGKAFQVPKASKTVTP